MLQVALHISTFRCRLLPLLAGWLFWNHTFCHYKKSESCFLFDNLFFRGKGGKFQHHKNKSFNVQYQRVISSTKVLIFTLQNQQKQLIHTFLLVSSELFCRILSQMVGWSLHCMCRSLLTKVVSTRVNSIVLLILPSIQCIFAPFVFIIDCFVVL